MRLGPLSTLAVALLIAPATAVAGAPNYDCVAAGNARLSIDQWADVVAATGFRAGPTAWGTASKVDQNGASLNLVATLRGASWSIAIRGTGTSVRIDRPAVTLRGACEFVPGNYVLRRADAGGSVLRAGPSAQARRLVRILPGTAVWEIPDLSPQGRWLPIRTFVTKDGSIRAVDGWLLQRTPLEPRCPGGHCLAMSVPARGRI